MRGTLCVIASGRSILEKRFVEGKTTMHFRRRCLVKLLAPAFLFSLVACANGKQPSAVSPPDSLVRPQSSASNSGSTFFATAAEESFSTYQLESDGDLWPSCWADDDNLYTANGDGRHSRMPPVVTTWP